MLRLGHVVPKRRSVRAQDPRAGARNGRIFARVWCGTFAVLGLIDNSAAAQERSVDVERFKPAYDEAGFIGLDGTRTPEPGRLTLGLIGDLEFDPVELEQTVPVETRVVTHVIAQVGLFGRLAVGAHLPVIWQQSGQLPADSDQTKLDSFALIDPELALRYRVLGTSMAHRDAPRDGPGLALQLAASLPIGSEDAYAGEGAVRTDAALLADFQLLGAGIGASLGYRHHFQEDVPARDEFTFAFGLKLPLPPLPQLVTALELRGATEFQSEATTAVELGLGATLTLADFAIVLAGAFGLSDGIGTPDGRVTLGLRWAPSIGDADADGLSDSDDECPFLAEDFDGYQDHDGCAEPDNDNDLVPDLDDRCPDEQAEEGRDEDEDGCTDPQPQP
jgi:hypothetical protein